MWKKHRRRREKLNDSTSQGLLITINNFILIGIIRSICLYFWENKKNNKKKDVVFKGQDFVQSF